VVDLAYNSTGKWKLTAADHVQWICWFGELLRKGCVVYSVGSKGNILFEEEVLRRNPTCHIFIFDPFTLPGRGRIHTQFFLRQRALGQENASICSKKTCSVAKNVQTIMREEGHNTVHIFKVRMDIANSIEKKW